MKFRAITELSAALALILMSAGCDSSAPTNDIDQVPPQAVQRSASGLVEPHRYLRLSDLADAIRKAGHPCEVVKSYKKIAEIDKGSSIYKIDCLEYSFRLTLINGQSRIERLTANDIRE